MRKSIAVMLAAAMLLLLLGGCAGQQAPAPSATPEEVSATPSESAAPVEPAEETAQPEEAHQPEKPTVPMTEPEPDMSAYPINDDDSISLDYWSMKLMGITDHLDMMNNHKVLQKAKEITGVDVNWLEVSPPVASEQFNLMIASGDMSDMMFQGMNYYAKGGDKAIEDEIFLRLNELIEQYAPNYDQIVKTDPNLIRDTRSDNGNVTAFYIINENDNLYDFGNITRTDLLEAAGLDVPVTYDDWYEMLTAYKTLGVKYPTVKLGDLNNTLFAGFGVPMMHLTMMSNFTSYFFVKDGQVNCSWLDEGYETMLTTMNKWYTEGLVAESYSTMGDLSIAQAQQYSGEAGVWTGYADAMSLYDKNTAVEGSTAIAIPEPVMNEGDTIHVGNQATRLGRDCAAITTCCEYPELAVGWLDFFYGGYGSFMVNWGFEGEAFEYGDDGVPYFTDLIINNPDGMTFENSCNLYTGVAFPGYFNDDRLTWHFTDAQKDAIEKWNSNRDSEYMLSTYISMTTEESEEYTKIFSDISTFFEENNAKFISGDKPFGELADFRSQIESMGIARCMEIIQTAYERYLNRVQ